MRRGREMVFAILHHADTGAFLKVTHIITGLEAGGAETMLLKLLSSLNAPGESAEVISLAPEGPLADPIRALGVPVMSLGLGGGLGALFGLPRLIRELRRSVPDLVQCWMYHANLLGGLAARVGVSAPVLWGLRQSDLDPALSKRSTIMVAKLGARLSFRVAQKILCVSESARQVHVALGYDDARMVVIPNGFDLARFRPDAEARREIRADLGIGPDDILIGLAARFDPQKDIGNFLAACARLAAPKARFVLCGTGMDGSNDALVAMIKQAGLGERVHLLGRRNDMARLTAALDIAVSSSAFGEGFSNTLGEALACGVPAVATDVGDSRLIVGAAGRVVPPRDAGALAAGIEELIALGPEGRAALGRQGRERMARDYGLAAIAERYRTLYAEILSGDGRT
jgi:glycosyltransferase involved in cell wall biosynthesis